MSVDTAFKKAQAAINEIIADMDKSSALELTNRLADWVCFTSDQLVYDGEPADTPID